MNGEPYQFLRHVEQTPDFIQTKRSMRWFWGSVGDVTDEINEQLNKLYEERKK